MARTKDVSQYIFAEIDKKIAEVRASGVDVISLGVGDPDSPPPARMLKKLAELVTRPDMHNYPPYEGTLSFRQAAARYIRRRYGLSFDPETEIVGLIGSKEGIGNTFIGMTEEGTVNIVPSLAYPIPRTATLIAGGRVHAMPILESNGFLPRIEDIPEDVARSARLMYVNYPNNPTGVGATEEFFRRIVEFAEEFDIIVISDTAYEEIYFQQPPPSIMQIPGAKKRVLEFHSLSKLFNVTGWRIGFVLGASELLEPLRVMKTNLDSGQFKPIQEASAWALDNLADTFGARQRATYRRRISALRDALERMGCSAPMPAGSFFLWGRVPENMTSQQFSEAVLQRYGVFITPGFGFGPEGEGYFRASLTITDERLNEALERFEKGGYIL